MAVSYQTAASGDTDGLTAYNQRVGAIVKGKLSGWAIFLGVLFLLSFAATPSFRYSRTADLTLMGIRFSLVILLSILFVREKWKHRDDDDHPQAASGTNDTILQRVRRWYYDEERNS